jgi:uncharacterized protein YggE
MDPFLDVVGEASRPESTTRHCGEVTVTARDRTPAKAFESLSRVWNSARASLDRAGISTDETHEGEVSFWNNWWRYGCKRTLIVRVRDFDRYLRLQEALAEELARNTRSQSIEWHRRPPVYDAAPTTRTDALVQAYEDARQKATALCTKMGLTLGETLLVREQVIQAPARDSRGDWVDCISDLDEASRLYSYSSGEDGVSYQADIATRPVRCLCRFAIGASVAT